MKVAVVGAGQVGKALGGHIAAKPSFSVKYGTRSLSSDAVKSLLSEQPNATAVLVADAVDWADVIVLATPSYDDPAGIKDVAASLGEGVKGKVLLDATNPLTKWPGLEVSWGRPEMLSGGEVLAAALPDTYVYKAFNTVGVEQLANPDGSLINGTQLTMLYAGPREKSGIAGEVISAAGFKPYYVGGIRYARNLEAIAEIWIHLSAGLLEAENWGRNFHFHVAKKE